MSSPVHAKLRLACPSDAGDMASVLADCWPDDTPDPSRIARLIGMPGRATVVAVAGGQAAGLMDAFSTVAADGLERWEMDLLAVLAAARGQGTGGRLVAEAVRAAPPQAQLARALVRLGNRPAERAFTGAGFVAGEPRGLFTAAPQQGAVPEYDLGFILVDTLTYSGLWIERRISEAALVGARALAFDRQLDQVGAVVNPGGSTAFLCARAGFREQGVYRWWSLVLGEGLSQRRRDVVAHANNQ